MARREQIERVVYSAVDELNKQLPKDGQVEKFPDASLYGKGGRLESLDFVTFVMEVETKIQDEFGIELVLTDEDLLSKQTSQFATLGTLIEYLESRVTADGEWR